jgi:23S rRNA (uracil1939-C5)-methyltransferase
MLLESMWDAHTACGGRAREMALRAGVNTGERLAIVFGDRTGRQAAPIELPYSCVRVDPYGREELVSGQGHYTERVLGRPFRVSAEAFFQNNTAQAERLIEAAGHYLQLQPGETLLDAYAGGGLFGLSLAGPANRLWGIESSAASIRDARTNATGHGTFRRGEVAAVLAEYPLKADAVVLDPPRTGCTPETVDALAACGASRIAYVSCDPATLARDVARFATHGYRFVEAQPVDLFPQTYHIECVALLSNEG